ncbi:hypothetical protein K458DRAFT_407016 [Lentithecium fluviatile CBS 122367]|uniref:Secreted protein n=1 Tax=Lentithecium fluviatile CBS 122367 TaxID=1168545 RepID=A0A6G1IRL6_9PLEO|nr:hypothetical protein K458DRAFT_407016 [Lentithecium fluviatile CBS 122367]
MMQMWCASFCAWGLLGGPLILGGAAAGVVSDRVSSMALGGSQPSRGYRLEACMFGGCTVSQPCHPTVFKTACGSAARNASLSYDVAVSGRQSQHTSHISTPQPALAIHSSEYVRTNNKDSAKGSPPGITSLNTTTSDGRTHVRLLNTRRHIHRSQPHETIRQDTRGFTTTRPTCEILTRSPKPDNSTARHIRA